MKVTVGLLFLSSQFIFGSFASEESEIGGESKVDMPSIENTNSKEGSAVSAEHMDEPHVDKNYSAEDTASTKENVKSTEHRETSREIMHDQEVMVSRDYYKVSSSGSSGIDETLSYDQSIDTHNYGTNQPYRILSDLEDKSQLSPSEKKQYNAEIEAGDLTSVFGTNTHIKQPNFYSDLGRRFVLQYPYKDKTVNVADEVEEDRHLIPVKASPELVLAVAKESARIEAKTNANSNDEFKQKDILRSGNYWNSYWKEDVDPKMPLRSQSNKMQGIRVKLTPGTKIYDVVSKLEESSPKLLYVINKNYEY